MLPDHYASATELPFNAAAVAGRFLPEPPDSDPGGAGSWLLLRGGELLLDEHGFQRDL